MADKREASAYEPIEVTTHNVYFHDESPVLSVDGYNGMVATCGCDKTVRLWRIASAQESHKENVYRTAVDSSTSLELLGELSGFSRPINCVRFYQPRNEEAGPSGREVPAPDAYILAACSDAGKVIVYEGGKSIVVRREDGDDAYDMCWADGRLFVGFASGRIETYAMEHELDEGNPGPGGQFVRTFKLSSSYSAHKSTIQGMAYNSKYDLLATHSLDRSVKVTSVEDNEPQVLTTFDEQIDHSRGLFKRLQFNNNSLFLLAGGNVVNVYAYPFRKCHLHRKIGPLNAAVVKILEGYGLTFVCTRKSVYVFSGPELVVCIDEVTFMTVTDACLCNNILFISAMDGFLASVKFALPGK